MNELSLKFNIDRGHIFSIWNQKCWCDITSKYIPNIILEVGYSYEEILYIITNPHNLLSWELAEIFNCTLCNINAIQRKDTYEYITKDFKLNRQLGSKSKVFYKYHFKNNTYYVSSILRFYRNITKGKIGRTSLDELANKVESNIKGWTCEEITKEEYISYLKLQYNEYKLNKKEATSINE